MMSWGNNMGTGDWVASIIAMLVIVTLIIGIFAWLLYPGRHRDSAHGQTGDSANEILNRRLASGEITAAQYHQLRETFEPQRSP